MSSMDYANKQLPKQFVKSLKVLFDILDEHNTGYVHLSDIESRWKGFNVDGLPKGIIESWRSVAMPDMRLNFDKFLSGISMSLAKQSRTVLATTSVTNNNNNKYVSAYRTVSNSHPDLISSNQPANQQAHVAPVSMVRPHSREMPSYGCAPVKEEEKSNLARDMRWCTGSSPISKQRTFSMPQLPNAVKSTNGEILVTDNLSGSNKENIVHVLKKWQTEQMGSMTQTVDPPLRNEPRSSVASLSALDYYSDTEGKKSCDTQTVVDDTAVGTTRRRIVKRHDGRRHTVSSGVDFQMIKKMRRLKQEEGVLMHGLEMLDKARHWYLEQIKLVQERQKYLGTAVSQGSNVDVDQDLNIQAARISEVNHQLNLLIHSTDKAFPHHMNLAIHGNDGHLNKQLHEQSELIVQLTQQNKQLSREVSHMAETIKKLEQEKTQVIREMFHASSKNRRTDHEESSYI